ncbi:MAG: hypothetical protein LBS81_00505 [Endomicrobium sp.]|jgi:hypothetical protein|nr:hypothetical protein [Endomicrobium sp.]
MYIVHPTDDVFKVTIKSHQKSLGFVVPIPKEEIHNEYKVELLADIMVALAGYAAEKLNTIQLQPAFLQILNTLWVQQTIRYENLEWETTVL